MNRFQEEPGRPQAPDPVINEEYRKVLAGVMQSVTWHLLRLEAQPYSARPGFKDEWRLA